MNRNDANAFALIAMAVASAAIALAGYSLLREPSSEHRIKGMMKEVTDLQLKVFSLETKVSLLETLVTSEHGYLPDASADNGAGMSALEAEQRARDVTQNLLRRLDEMEAEVLRTQRSDSESRSQPSKPAVPDNGESEGLHRSE